MRTLLTIIATILPTHLAVADVIQTGDILDSYAFSTGSIDSGSSLSLNLWNDSTGARLTTDNGDRADLTISYTRNVSGATASSTSGSLEYQGSQQRLRASHDYDSSTRTANNPGTRITHAIDFMFADHLTVTGLDVDFTSLNTAGITWEFSKLGYIVAGNPANNAEPTVSAYDSHNSVNGQAPGVGWFLVDSKATATQVGQDTVVAGGNGSLEQLTDTNGNSLLDYVDVGLDAGTQITGFRWITVLEDVRGINNPASGLTASMTHFSPSGTISAVPEPSAAVALSFTMLLSFLPFRRTKR